MAVGQSEAGTPTARWWVFIIGRRDSRRITDDWDIYIQFVYYLTL
jgi:hypothetical protein